MTIDEHLARRLIDSQFPQWADLPIAPVEFDGIDNRTFRLGEKLTVRLPSGEWYARQVDKEQRWLPSSPRSCPCRSRRRWPRANPAWDIRPPWSVYRWLDGEVASEPGIGDLISFATTLAAFLVELQASTPASGPAPGRHNFYRGGPLTTYADETHPFDRRARDEIPGDAASGCGTTPWRPLAARPSGSTATSRPGTCCSATAGWPR